MSWRDRLRPNSFRGVRFYVEEGGQAGGRRNAAFEFPKRDTPDVEDMGRRGRRFTISAYVLGANYTVARDKLFAALETEGPGTLIHQTLGSRLVNVDTYSTRESARRGGMCEFDITFLEAGSAGATRVAENTQGDVAKKADTAQAAVNKDLDNAPVSV